MKHGIRKIFLHPGEFVFGEPGTHIHTVLGSCIAICLWHPVLHIGGMCHFVLPSRPKSEPRSSDPDGRYGDEAMRLFDMALKLHQTSYQQYQSKIFGGANTYSDTGLPEEYLIGEKNTAKAVELLKIRNAEIKVTHVGGLQGHRRIVMDVTTGDVFVKHQTSKDRFSMKSQSGKI